MQAQARFGVDPWCLINSLPVSAGRLIALLTFAPGIAKQLISKVLNGWYMLY
jgi:hypothetical protein